MRRQPVLRAALGLGLVLGACAGDDQPASQTRPTSAFDVPNAAPTPTAAQAALCYSETARQISTAYVTAMQPHSNVAAVIAGLRQAAEVAPPELTEEFAVVLRAQIPFLEAVQRADGNVAAAARSESFRATLAQASGPEAVRATSAISTWVAQHCRAPR